MNEFNPNYNYDLFNTSTFQVSSHVTKIRKEFILEFHSTNNKWILQTSTQQKNFRSSFLLSRFTLPMWIHQRAFTVRESIEDLNQRSNPKNLLNQSKMKTIKATEFLETQPQLRVQLQRLPCHQAPRTSSYP